MFWAYFLVVVCVVRSTMAGCAEDLTADKDILKCFMDFATYIQQNSDDPSKMVEVMCSEEAKTKLKCVVEYAKQCPEVMGAGSDPSISRLLHHIKNLDAMCALVSGPCAQLRECVQQTTLMESIDESTSSGTNPFGDFQHMLGMLCGPVKKQFDCIKKYENQCPDMTELIQEEIRQAIKSSKDEDLSPGFDVVVKFVSEECPRVPPTFSKNKCVRDKFASEEFEQCLVNSVNMPQEKEDRCGVYLASKKCIEDHVGQCGAREAEVVVKAAHLTLYNVPSNCEMQVVGDDDNSGSGIKASLATLFMVIAIRIALLQN